MASPSTVYQAAEGQKFAADTTLEVVTCATCHITYAIPASLKRSALKYPGDGPNGWKLCCPLGHTWWYTGKSEAEKLKRKLEFERERAGRVTAQLDQTKALLKGQKARAARFKNERDRERLRVAAGVCPCCNRSFKDLARHMAGQHPGFATDHSEADDG